MASMSRRETNQDPYRDGGGDAPCWAHMTDEPLVTLDPSRRAEVELLATTTGRAVVVCDGEGRVLLWSDAARRLLGRGEQEMMGRSIELVISPQDRARFWRTFFDVLRSTDDSPPEPSVGVDVLDIDGRPSMTPFDHRVLWKEDDTTPTCVALLLGGTPP